jgi:outer membrane protein TolC
VNKTSIKIIKRKDAEAAATAKIQNADAQKETAEANEEKKERRSRREIGDTISNWISDRRENKRTEEDTANSEIFGDKSLLKEI